MSRILALWKVFAYFGRRLVWSSRFKSIVDDMGFHRGLRFYGASQLENALRFLELQTARPELEEAGGGGVE